MSKSLVPLVSLVICQLDGTTLKLFLLLFFFSFDSTSVHFLYSLVWKSFVIVWYWQILLLRQKLKTPVQGQKNMCISVYSNVMGGKVWLPSRGWRRSSATTKFSRTLRRSFAAMVQLSRTQSWVRSGFIYAVTSNFWLCVCGLFLTLGECCRLYNFKVTRGRTYRPSLFRYFLLC